MTATQGIRERLERETERCLSIVESLGQRCLTVIEDEKDDVFYKESPDGKGPGTIRHKPPSRAFIRAFKTYEGSLARLKMDSILRDKLAIQGRILENLTDEQYHAELATLRGEAVKLMSRDELLRELEERGELPKLLGTLSADAPASDGGP